MRVLYGKAGPARGDRTKGKSTVVVPAKRASQYNTQLDFLAHFMTDSFSSEPVKDLATRPTPAPGSRQREIPRCYALPRRPTAHSIEKRAPFHSNKRESRCVEETKIATCTKSFFSYSHTGYWLTVYEYFKHRKLI
ncbi:hypothetical protein SDJN03_17106, partial [Cucurbita argyrosperma subsp. sororia]